MYLEDTLSPASLELVSTKLLVGKDIRYIRYDIGIRAQKNERSEFDPEIGSKSFTLNFVSGPRL